MQKKNKNKPIEKKMKNQLFKNKVIISPDELKEKLSSILGSENETARPNIQNNKILNDLFDENKFKIRNDFDSDHCEEFLEEKEKYLRPMNLDNSLSDEDEKTDVVNRISSKFTFGHYI